MANVDASSCNLLKLGRLPGVPVILMIVAFKVLELRLSARAARLRRDWRVSLWIPAFFQQMPIVAIGRRAFAAAQDYDLNAPTYWGDALDEVVIDEGLKTIGAMAFAWHRALRKVVLPGSLASIARDAFLGVPPSCVFVVRKGSYADAWAKNAGFRREFVNEPTTSVSLRAEFGKWSEKEFAHDALTMIYLNFWRELLLKVTKNKNFADFYFAIWTSITARWRAGFRASINFHLGFERVANAQPFRGIKRISNMRLLQKSRRVATIQLLRESGRVATDDRRQSRSAWATRFNDRRAQRFQPRAVRKAFARPPRARSGLPTRLPRATEAALRRA